MIDSLEADHWIIAIDDKINLLTMLKTWEVVLRLKDHKTVESKWVFKIKHNANGEIAHYKA